MVDREGYARALAEVDPWDGHAIGQLRARFVRGEAPPAASAEPWAGDGEPGPAGEGAPTVAASSGGGGCTWLFWIWVIWLVLRGLMKLLS